MKKEEYIKTLNVNGIDINLGMDDYGQCLFIEFFENGKKVEIGLGSYNSNYMEEIYSILDSRYRELLRKYYFDDEGFSDEEEEEYNNYLKLFSEEYKN